METNKTPEQIAQWVIDNRYPKGEYQNTPDSEIYHTILDGINDLTKPLIEQTTKLQADKDRLAEQLKEIKADIDFLGHYSPTATKITETLSECGYNI